jgi:hypothetical protein
MLKWNMTNRNNNIFNRIKIKEIKIKINKMILIMMMSLLIQLILDLCKKVNHMFKKIDKYPMIILSQIVLINKTLCKKNNKFNRLRVKLIKNTKKRH